MRLIPAPEHGDVVGLVGSRRGVIFIDADNVPVSDYPNSEGWQVTVLTAAEGLTPDVLVRWALDHWTNSWTDLPSDSREG